jgi:hypothetical protein
MRVGFPSINLKRDITKHLLLSNIDLLIELSLGKDLQDLVDILFELAYNMLVSVLLRELP